MKFLYGVFLMYTAWLSGMDTPIPRLKPAARISTQKSSPRIQRIQVSPRPESSPRREINSFPSLACLTARYLAQENQLLKTDAIDLITPKDQSCVKEVLLRELVKPHIFPVTIAASQNKESVHHNGVCGLDFIPRTQEVVSGACDGKIVFCEKNSLAAGISYQLPLGLMTLTIVNTQPLEIFIGSDSGCIYRMNYETKKIEHYFKAHDSSINRVCVGDALFVSSSNDKTVKLWDKKTAASKGSFSKFKQAVRCIELFEDSHDLISGDSDGSLKLWDLNTKELVVQYNYPQDHKIWGMSLLMKAKRIVTGLNVRTGQGRLSVIDAEQFREIGQWYAHGHTIAALSSDEQEKYIATGSWDCKARLWDIRMRACAATFVGHDHWVTQVKCLGNEIVTGSRDNTLKIWDIRKIKEIDVQPLLKVATVASKLKNKPTLKEPKEREELLESFTKTN